MGKKVERIEQLKYSAFERNKAQNILVFCSYERMPSWNKFTIRFGTEGPQK